MIDKKKIRNLLNRAEMPYLVHQILNLKGTTTEKQSYLILKHLKESYSIQQKDEKSIQRDLEDLITEIKKEKENGNK